MEQVKQKLENYDGRIYYIRETYALRFKNGAFHYVNKENLKEAYENGFDLGYDKKVYSKMPWGVSHTGYEFSLLEKESLAYSDFINKIANI